MTPLTKQRASGSRACRSTGALLVALAITLALPSAGLAASYTFTPLADSYTRSDLPTTNFGDGGRLSAREHPRQTRDTYLRFDVDVPEGATITGATLRMYATTDGHAIELHGLADDSWDESAITWRNAPDRDSATADQADAVAADESFPLDASSLVSGGTVSMVLTSQANSMVRMVSRENDSHRPRLIVETTDSGQGETPGGTPDPGTDPAPDPGSDPAPDPGTDPAPDPGTDPAPDPGTDPAPDPGTDPAPDPGTDPAPDPGSDPAPDPGTPTPDPTPDPTPAPPISLGGLWSWGAASAPLDLSTAALSQRLISNVRSPNLAMTDWAVATADAKSGDPEYSIPRTDQGGSITVRIPLGTRPDPSDDGHLTVRDVARGIETDFWQARYDAASGRIGTTSAAISFPLGAVAAGNGWTGNAANTPLRRGLVTAEDMKAAIDAGADLPYTLQFGSPNIAQGAPRWPALHNVPTGDSSSVVEGTWVRLDPSYDVEGSGLPAWQKVIARTLQTRGAINRDNSGTFAIYGRNPVNGEAPWSTAGMSGSSAGFSSSFPWNRLQVLAPPLA